MGGQRKVKDSARLLLLLVLSGLILCQGAPTPAPSSAAKRPPPSAAKQPPPGSKAAAPKAAAAPRAGARGSTAASRQSGIPGIRRAAEAPVTAAVAPARNPTPAGWTGKWLPDQAKTLYLHNLARNKHGAASLSWDDGLAAQCQAWVNKCIWAHSDSSPRPNIGENIYFSYGNIYPAATAGESAVKSWYREKEKMNWRQPELTVAEGKIVGHFTAMVWRATQRMGCAWNSCKTLKNIKYNGTLPINLVACHYTPAGNWLGKFTQNVLPEGSTATTAPTSPTPAAAASPLAPTPVPPQPPATSSNPAPTDSSSAPQPTYTYYPSEGVGYYETPPTPYGQPFYYFGKRK